MQRQSQKRNSLTFLLITLFLFICAAIGFFQFLWKPAPIEPTIYPILQDVSPTVRPSATDVPTVTPQPSITPTATVTFTPVITQTPTNTVTSTITATPTITTTATATLTATPDGTGTLTLVAPGVVTPNITAVSALGEETGDPNFEGESPEPNAFVKPGSKLRLREQPSIDAAVLKELPERTALFVLSVTGDDQWYEVITLTDDYGWVNAQFVTMIDEAQAVCGDNVCQDDEFYDICPADCLPTGTYEPGVQG